MPARVADVTIDVTTMDRDPLRLAFVGVLLLAQALAPQTPPPGDLYMSEHPVVSLYLNCIECDSAELMRALEDVEPAERLAIVIRLDEIAQRGYTVSGRDPNVEHLTAAYRALEAYRVTHPENTLGSETLEDFLRLYLPSRTLWFQQRAIVMLGALVSLGTPEALTVLEHLLTLPLSEDLKNLVKVVISATNPP